MYFDFMANEKPPYWAFVRSLTGLAFTVFVLVQKIRLDKKNT
jgi:hypothetical protein